MTEPKTNAQRWWLLPVLFLLALTLLLIAPQVRADDLEEMHIERYVADGRYGIVASGEGMLDHAVGDIELDVPGASVKAAYLYWSGTANLGDGDDTVTLARDGQVVAQSITADPVSGTYGPKHWFDGFYYFVWVADVTEHVQVGDHIYSVSNFGYTMRRRDGAGLIVVYEDPSLPISRVSIKDGLDRFYRNWGANPRAETAVNCATFEPQPMDRDMEYWLFLGEVNAGEEPRPNALWYLSGTAQDPMPTDLVNAPTDGPTTGILIEGPPNYPFSSADDPQWDTYDGVVTLPAGNSWLCLQVESARDGDFQPASGMWLLTAGRVPAVGPTDVSVEKDDYPDPVMPGEQLAYSLTYENESEFDAEGVLVTDVLPVEVTFVDADPYPDDDTNPLIWDLGRLDPGESGTIAVTVTVGSWVTQTFTNTVLIGTETDETDYENNRDDEPTDILLLADTGIEKSDEPDPVMPGRQLAYTLSYVNHGPAKAVDATVSDELPPEVTFVDADPYPDDDTNPLVWNLGTLDVGQSGTIALTVTVGSWVTQIFTNTVEIGSSTPDPIPGNNEDDEPTTPLMPEIEVVKTVAPGMAVPGQSITYDLLVTNVGEVELDPVRVTDTLPINFEFIPGSGTPSDPDQIIGQQLIWDDLGALPVGDSLQVSFQAKAAPQVNGTFLNVVVASGESPVGPVSDTDDEPVLITSPQIEVNKTVVDWDQDHLAPNYVTYTIAVHNVGITTIAEVKLEDTFDPEYLSFSWGEPAPDSLEGGDTLVWNDLCGPAPNGFDQNLPPGDHFLVTTVFLVTKNITRTENIAVASEAVDIFDNPAPPDSDTEVILNVPTPVDLLSFTARPEGSQIVVEWETAWEQDNWGFDLFRTTGATFVGVEWLQFEQARGWGQFEGDYYRFDDASVSPCQEYYYWLEDIDMGNRRTRHGPVQTTSLCLTYLPLITR